MDIFAALTRHHQEMRELFAKSEENRDFFDDLKDHLRVHHRNEEKILYDVLKTRSKTRKGAMEAVEEHHIIEIMLVELENFPREHERWAIKLEVLEEYADHHFEEEEKEIFPEGAKVLQDTESGEMRAQFDKIKEQQLAVL